MEFQSLVKMPIPAIGELAALDGGFRHAVGTRTAQHDAILQIFEIAIADAIIGAVVVTGEVEAGGGQVLPVKVRRLILSYQPSKSKISFPDDPAYKMVVVVGSAPTIMIPV